MLYDNSVPIRCSRALRNSRRCLAPHNQKKTKINFTTKYQKFHLNCFNKPGPQKYAFSPIYFSIYTEKNNFLILLASEVCGIVVDFFVVVLILRIKYKLFWDQWFLGHTCAFLMKKIYSLIAFSCTIFYNTRHCKSQKNHRHSWEIKKIKTNQLKMCMLH